MRKFFKVWNFLHYAVALAILYSLCATICSAKVIAGNSKQIALSNKTIDSIQQLLLEPQADTTKLTLLYIISNQYCYKIRNAEVAQSYLGQALQLANHLIASSPETRLNVIRRRAICLSLMGSCFELKAEYQNALRYHLQALATFDAVSKYFPKKTIINKREVLHNIGVVYAKIKKYELAKKYFLQALGLSTANDNLTGSYTSLSAIAAFQKKYQESIHYARKTIDYAIRFDDNEGLAITYINLVVLYGAIKQNDSAKYYCNKALKLDRGLSNTTIIGIYTATAPVFIRDKDFAHASQLLFKARDLAERIGMKNKDPEIYQKLAFMYQEMGNFDKAYQYNLLYRASKDSALNERVYNEVNTIQTKYELAKKDREILVLNKNKEMAETIAAREHLMGNVFIGGFAGIFIISLVVARNLILKQRIKHRVLGEEKALVELQKQQVEKDIIKLLRENTEARYEVLKSKTSPHFLFNNLNILSSIIVKDTKAATEYIARFSEFYKMILKTSDQTLINLEEEMHLVAHYLYLQKIRFKNKLFVSIDANTRNSNFFVPPFAIQMTVENTIKHNVITHSDNLKISISIQDRQIVITNNLQRKKTVLTSALLGQKSITERYALLTSVRPLFLETETEFIVKLPLLELSETPVIKEPEDISAFA